MKTWKDELPVDIQTLWEHAKFDPNQQQRDAILHTEGPLFGEDGFVLPPEIGSFPGTGEKRGCTS